ncbi:hypothetical protein PISL3812_05134 [Talaromyces islandicus]|uniref:Xylanolytic transcriptional activator regulatory domain-containing protein n=1 Tax=Talaromyces islandicus TaxID=28573 RepID=A0A0U1LXK9_TALIS|nr:hypothetical protein PISL3812_05134 [Talaromyces islandicus]
MPLVSNDLAQACLPDSSQGIPQMNIHLVKAFYECFHPAHPILPPFEIWTASLPPQFLVNVVEFIGLHYTSPGQAAGYPHELWVTIGNATLSLEKVQAYLLLSIALHARKAPDGAKEYIGSAIQCSYELGLHRRELSDAMKIQNVARAESMRRTLWEVFIVDTLLAAVQAGGTLQFSMGTPDVPLPSEDAIFEDGNSNIPLISVKDLNRRLFTGDEQLSSLAYRVEATLILRQCVIACETYASEDTVQILDSLISTWFHRWPQGKSTILMSNGHVDQIDFQAAMIINCASIYLHFPRSSLIPYLPTTREIFCSRPPSNTAPSPNAQMHTAKIVNAAVELSKLGSLSTSVTRHTPFFPCTLVLSSIVQLTASSMQVGQRPGKYSSYLALNIAVLHSMGTIWDLAASDIGKIRDIACEVERTSTQPNKDIVEYISIQSVHSSS